MPALTVFGDCTSRHAYKLYLLKCVGGLDLEWVFVDILAGASRRPEHLARNPMGQVPTLVLDDGRSLPESNAALVYLADGTALWPKDPFDQAQVLRWLMFEQNQIDPALAVSLSIKKATYHLDNADIIAGYLAPKVERLLAALEAHLAAASSTWLVGEGATIADLAVYAYVHEAPSAGFNLAPATDSWLKAVEGLPGFQSVKQAMAWERQGA